LRSGTWQVAQANLPLAERRVSKKQAFAKLDRRRLPETRLLGSRVAGAGHGPCERIAGPRLR
jgi:hypothetical protein